MSLPKVIPNGGTPTSQDFVSLQTQWMRLLDPLVSAANAGDGIPVGTMWLWPTKTPPSEKYLVCDGTTRLQGQYMDLFRVMGTSQNTGGEPAGSFRLPAASGAYTLLIKAVP